MPGTPCPAAIRRADSAVMVFRITAYSYGGDINATATCRKLTGSSNEGRMLNAAAGGDEFVKQVNGRCLGPIAGRRVSQPRRCWQRAGRRRSAARADPIAQIPLTVAIPAHPQVLFALANSESMDGDMIHLLGGGGAIMTGRAYSVAAGHGPRRSSSPVNYTIPASFTPPVDPGAAGLAPYTVTSAALLVDNSAEPSERRQGRRQRDPECLHGVCGFRADGLLHRRSRVVHDLGLLHEPPVGFTFTECARRRTSSQSLLSTPMSRRRHRIRSRLRRHGMANMAADSGIMTPART